MGAVSKDEPTCQGIRKHLTTEVEAALRTLRQARLSDEDVHRARKVLKKARASLRLLRPGCDSTAYRVMNQELRDAARPLSAVRDTKVLIDTLRSLTQRYGEPARVLQLEGFVRVLTADRAEKRRQVLSSESTVLAHSRHLLRQVLARGKALDFQDKDWSILSAGLKRIYAAGLKAMNEARDSPSPDAFHEWRKQGKYLRHALERFQPIWPALIGKWAEQTHKLVDYLGEDHDLTVLREQVLAHRSAFAEEASWSALSALAEQRQKQLRKKAIWLGLRLYEEKPKAFVARLGTYWHNWQCDGPKSTGARGTRSASKAQPAPTRAGQ